MKTKTSVIYFALAAIVIAICSAFAISAASVSAEASSTDNISASSTAPDNATTTPADTATTTQTNPDATTTPITVTTTPPAATTTPIVVTPTALIATSTIPKPVIKKVITPRSTPAVRPQINPRLQLHARTATGTTVRPKLALISPLSRKPPRAQNYVGTISKIDTGGLLGSNSFVLSTQSYGDIDIVISSKTAFRLTSKPSAFNKLTDGGTVIVFGTPEKDAQKVDAERITIFPATARNIKAAARARN